MSALQSELLDMTKDLSDDTMQLLIGMVQQFVIPMDHKATKSVDTSVASERIGFLEGADLIAPGYDFDEYDPEIAKMFGVNV